MIYEFDETLHKMIHGARTTKWKIENYFKWKINCQTLHETFLETTKWKIKNHMNNLLSKRYNFAINNYVARVIVHKMSNLVNEISRHKTIVKQKQRSKSKLPNYILTIRRKRFDHIGKC